ncbi:DUF2934 domain-containing protein [Thermodesulfobacterium sp. TA1]|uniref:DUF2934 domain-containing protein n=1 Tax=Thermodesulfobacterium sp. TA1 TaxID=2234087 RepID=UPI0012324552|nr:DUF2934 domain-containing protein [Thermodesulfobacterium sp. TA1]QER42812.1 DUF2934 domain-containing protein [Thermodesulfobacterium sp. TA1]
MDKKALEDEIRMVAYELYVKSGCIPGRDLDNWLEAERIVLAKYGLIQNQPSQETSPGLAPEEKPKSKGKCKKKAEEGTGVKRKGRCKKKE